MSQQHRGHQQPGDRHAPGPLRGLTSPASGGACDATHRVAASWPSGFGAKRAPRRFGSAACRTRFGFTVRREPFEPRAHVHPVVSRSLQLLREAPRAAATAIARPVDRSRSSWSVMAAMAFGRAAKSRRVPVPLV